MNLAEKLGFSRFRGWNRGLAPQKRSMALVSIAESLAAIAYGLKIIVQKEYGVNLDDPMPTRADMEREVFEPMYPDDAAEAVREEIERLQQIEREINTADGVRVSERGGDRRSVVSLSSAHRAGEDDDLTPEERRFLREELGRNAEEPES
jgi:hypothetical protein